MHKPINRNLKSSAAVRNVKSREPHKGFIPPGNRSDLLAPEDPALLAAGLHPTRNNQGHDEEPSARELAQRYYTVGKRAAAGTLLCVLQLLLLVVCSTFGFLEGLFAAICVGLIGLAIYSARRLPFWRKPNKANPPA